MAILNRLILRHVEQLFDTRENAIRYVLRKMGNAETDGKKTGAVFGEPLVLRYQNPNDSKNPNVILAIGSVGSGEASDDNRYFFIDSAKLVEDIKALQNLLSIDEGTLLDVISQIKKIKEHSKEQDTKLQEIANSLEEFIKKVADDKQGLEALITKNHVEVEKTNSVEMFKEVSDDGTVLSAKIKLSEHEGNQLVVRPVGTAAGLYMNVNMVYESLDSNSGNIVLNVNGEAVAKINIQKEQFLSDIQYDEKKKELIFKFKKEGQEGTSEIVIPIKDLIDVYTAGDGLIENNNKFSIKLSPTADADFITVTSDGLSVHGIKDAINDAADTLDKKISTLNRYVIDADADLTKKISAEQQRAQVTEHALEDLISKNVQDEQLRAEKAEADLADKVNKEQIRAEGAEHALEDLISEKVSEETMRASNAESELDDKILTEQQRAEKAENDLDKKIENVQTKGFSVDDTNTIHLNRQVNPDGTVLLKGNVKISSENFNAVKEYNDGIYVKDFEQSFNTLTDKVTTNTENISKEVERATQAETNLENKISTVEIKILNETNRATTVENELNASINSNAQELENTKASFNGRITTLENTINETKDKLNTTTDSVASNKGKIELLSKSIETVESNINDIKGEVSTIQSKNEEQTQDINKVRTDLTEEITRAKGVESTFTTRVDGIDTRLTNVESSITSHTSEYNDLLATVSGLTSTTGSHTTDIETLKSNVQNIIGIASANTTAIQAEADRAKGKESDLKDLIDDERQRATTAEKENDNNIKDEAAKRDAEDKKLAERITEEYTNRVNAVNEINSQFNNVDNSINNINEEINKFKGFKIEQIAADESTTTISTRYRLIDAAGHQYGTTIDIEKSKILEDVRYDSNNKDIVFSFNTADDETKEIRINAADLNVTYRAGNGLSSIEDTDGATFNVKVKDGDSFLNSDENGISFNPYTAGAGIELQDKTLRVQVKDGDQFLVSDSTGLSFRPYTFDGGLELNGKTVGVNVKNDSFLTVDSNGLHFTPYSAGYGVDSSALSEKRVVIQRAEDSKGYLVIDENGISIKPVLDKIEANKLAATLQTDNSTNPTVVLELSNSANGNTIKAGLKAVLARTLSPTPENVTDNYSLLSTLPDGSLYASNRTTEMLHKVGEAQGSLKSVDLVLNELYAKDDTLSTIIGTGFTVSNTITTQLNEVKNSISELKMQDDLSSDVTELRNRLTTVEATVQTVSNKVNNLEANIEAMVRSYVTDSLNEMISGGTLNNTITTIAAAQAKDAIAKYVFYDGNFKSYDDGENGDNGVKMTCEDNSNVGAPAKLVKVGLGQYAIINSGEYPKEE